MFIRNRRFNKSLTGYVLVLFVFASAFTQSSGTLSLYVIKALGSSLDKAKQLKTSTLQFPCSGTEEEKKGEQKSEGFHVRNESIHSDVYIPLVFILFPEPKISGRIASPIFLLIKSLRL